MGDIKFKHSNWDLSRLKEEFDFYIQSRQLEIAKLQAEIAGINAAYRGIIVPHLIEEKANTPQAGE